MATRQDIGLSSKKVLVVILLLGLLVRLVGIPFGLPYLYNVDETRFAKISLNYFTGDLNPHFFRWPSFYFYIVHVLYLFFLLPSHGFAIYKNPGIVRGHFINNPTPFFLSGRIFSAPSSVAIPFSI